ncbi:MAG: tRNA uridine-5-carboxymethylaminomethyl(34) synthesis GTPase MnmE [Spirochaetaceae bacterium]|jgi:tRNA modification GTPase|nr:tRNA uridine-5-carboxymethylaminomethyl(34) synthesis GTPase MnmE [Spirochaetaceae bacterium]
MSPAYGDDSPIAALATPPGESALALIRTSGKDAVDRLAAVFSRPGALRRAPGNTVVYGWITGPGGERLDQVMVSVFRAPRSFTGEEGAEIACHGGSAVIRGVLGALRDAGFRDALPGEFSFRAFMNGKLDLTRAESVMELVFAKTGRSRDRALGRLSGALEQEIRGINALLVQVLAGAELFLDYSEDEVSPGGEDGDEAAGRLPQRARAEEALGRLRTLAASYRLEKLYREGALAVIAGRPNAGKSSLFNRLLKEDRAIVTEIPGTTRDWIEAWISLEGIPLRLVDTAGLHDAQDPVERLGIARTRELLAQADLILYVIDPSAGFEEEVMKRGFCPDQRSARTPRPHREAAVLTMWNKADRFPPPPDSSLLALSAKTGEGIPELIAAMVAALEADFGTAEAGASAGLGSPRQKELVDRAVASLEEALDLSDRAEPLDLVAPLLRDAVNALGEITGEVSTADILEAMFSRFCVGK